MNAQTRDCHAATSQGRMTWNDHNPAAVNAMLSATLGRQQVERIFVLDDEENMCLALERVLRRAGYDVRYGFESDALYRTTATWQPNLVVLDVRLGREDGREVARTFRSMYDVPILMLTGQVGVEDRISGLESGADDYLCKPYDPGELVARVRAMLRRASLLTDGRDTNLPIRVDKNNRTLIAAGGGEERITELQANIMTVLLDRRSEVISREALYSLVFKRPWVPGDRSLDVHVSNLRKALQRITPEHITIQSIRNVGYRLILDKRDAEKVEQG